MLVNGACADYGSEFCPCYLAESGSCVVCSRVNGKDSCDCRIYGGGFCVLEELERQNGKAKPVRPTITCKVITVFHRDSFSFFRLKVPPALEQSLMHPGSFVFVRIEDNPWFDLPVSVQYDESTVGSIGMSVILRGPKTMGFAKLKQGDTVFLRGPFFNGLYGKREIQSQNSGKCLLLIRGIGLLPSISVISHLREQQNDVRILLDETGFPKKDLMFYLDLFELTAESFCLVTDDGKLSEAAKEQIQSFLASGGDFIHIGASEYVIHLVTAFLKETGAEHVRISCCNNAKMCCGEGICGACTFVSSEKRTIHSCKEQVSIWRSF